MNYTKVILLDDMPPLGNLGDIVTVRSGYARNKLFPAGLGERYSEQAYAGFAKRKEEIRKEKAQKISTMQAFCKKLEGFSVQVVVKADSEGKLYGSFSVANLITELSQQGFALTKKQIAMPEGESLKQTGTYAVVVTVSEGLTANMNVTLVSDQN